MDGVRMRMSTFLIFKLLLLKRLLTGLNEWKLVKNHECVVEPSYEKITGADANFSGNIRKKRGEAALSKFNPRWLNKMVSTRKGMYIF